MTTRNMTRALIAILAVLALFAAPVQAVTTEAQERAHPYVLRRYKPTGRWCPTNRTCYLHVHWRSYGLNRAVAVGPAKECPGGYPQYCRFYPNLVAVFDREQWACAGWELTRLRVLGRVFYAGEGDCGGVFQGG